MIVLAPAAILFVMWGIASLSVEWRIDALRNHTEAGKRQKTTEMPIVFDSTSWTGSAP